MQMPERKLMQNTVQIRSRNRIWVGVLVKFVSEVNSQNETKSKMKMHVQV